MVEEPPNNRWFYLAIATLSQVSLATIHLGIPTLMPLIQEELRLNLTEVGVLVSVVNLGVVASAVGAGKLADRFGERLVIGYGTIAGGFLILLVHLAASFPTLLSVFLLLGVPMATGTPAGSKAVAGWFRPTERATAMGIRQTGIPLGGTIAALILPSIALASGWRSALSAVGIITIIVGLGVLKLYREPARITVKRESIPVVGIREILRRRDIWAVTLYAATLAGGQWCYLSYIELYLTRDVYFPLVLAAALLAAGQIGGASGRIITGLMSDRLFAGRRRPVMILLGLLAIVMCLGTASFSPSTPKWCVAIIVASLGFATMSWQGLYLTLVAEIVGTRRAGQAIGLTNTVVFSGIVLFPPVFGFIGDATATYRWAWIAAALLIIAPLWLVGRLKEGNKS